MINCHILKTMYMKEGIMSIEINRRLHEALGRCWHEYDHWKGRRQVCRCEQWLWYFDAPIEWDNPDYCLDPRLVIAAMRDECWTEFVVYIGGDRMGLLIPVYLIMDTTGKLAQAAQEWLVMKGR